jgi:8-oxo-dGTP diphosphatase
MPSFVRFSETGLTISSPRLCGITDWCKDGVRHVVLLYRAERGLVGGARRSPSLDLASSDMLDLLRVFEEDDLSELFYRQNGEDWTYELK